MSLSTNELSSQMLDDWRNALKHNFGLSDFKDYQLHVIRKILLDRTSLLAIMPTGHGKSLCYQFPAVWLNGITLVISPLLSLIEDQCQRLNQRGISAQMISGNSRLSESIGQDIMDGKYRIIFTTPEQLLASGRLLRFIGSQLCLVAIDEAHCVSQWGKFFRPTYRRIVEGLGEWFGRVPILALTATAPPNIAKDICACFEQTLEVFRVSSQKKNLSISVGPKGANFKESLTPLLTGAQGATIIYCNSCEECRTISDWINHELGYKSDYYHAKRTTEEKQAVQSAFLRDEIAIVVATIAFGMGIDKSNVRLVINWGSPGNLTDYYQEIGRAGRDGQACQAVMFWSQRDFSMAEFMLKNEVGVGVGADVDVDTAASVLEYGTHQIKQIKHYCSQTQTCRQMFLECYLATPAMASNIMCDCCDVCRVFRGHVPKRDVGALASVIFEQISRSKPSSLGVNKHIDNLRGLEGVCCYPRSYGKLSKYTNEWLQNLFSLLINHGYLNLGSSSGRGRKYAVELSKLAADWMLTNESRPRLVLPIDDQHRAIMGVLPDVDLLAKLIERRNQLANEHQTAPVAICQDSLLEHLATHQPHEISQVMGSADNHVWIKQLMQVYCEPNPVKTPIEPPIIASNKLVPSSMLLSQVAYYLNLTARWPSQTCPEDLVELAPELSRVEVGLLAAALDCLSHPNLDDADHYLYLD